MSMYVVRDQGDKAVDKAKANARPGERVMSRVVENRKGTGSRVVTSYIGGKSERVSAASVGLNRDPRKW